MANERIPGSGGSRENAAAEVRAEIKRKLIALGIKENEVERVLLERFDLKKDQRGFNKLLEDRERTIERWVHNISTEWRGNQREDKEEGAKEENSGELHTEPSESERAIFENAERISVSEFVESFKNPGYRESLQNNISQRDGMVKEFMKLHGGLLVRDMKRLEDEGELEGYTLSKNLASTLSRQLKSMGDSPVDRTVASSLHHLWGQYANASDRLLQTLSEYKKDEPAEKKDEKKAEEKSAEPESVKKTAEQVAEPMVTESDVYRESMQSIREASPEREAKRDSIKSWEEAAAAHEGGLEDTPENALIKWSESRRKSDELERQYQDGLRKFYEEREKKWYAGIGRFFGIEPKLTTELQQLKGESTEAKKQYKLAASNLSGYALEAHRERRREDGQESAMELANRKRLERGESALHKEEWDHRVRQRYERLLAQKLLVRSLAERNAIQADVVKRLHPEGSKTLNFLKKHAWNIRYASVGSAVILGTIATGGVAGAIIGGTAAVGAIGGGMVGSRVLGGLTRLGLDKFYLQKKAGEHRETSESTKTKLFGENFNELERRLEQSWKGYAEAQRNTRVAVAGASVAGGLTGAVAGGIGGYHIGSEITEGLGLRPEIAPGPPTTERGETPPSEPEAGPKGLHAFKENPDGSMDDIPDEKKVTESYRGLHGFETNPDGSMDDIPDESKIPEKYQGLHAFKSEGEGVMSDIPEKPQPEVAEPPSGKDGVPPAPAPEATPAPELASKSVEVQKGDSFWNLMEGKGPDADPVGGHSDVVKDMPRGLRNWSLDTLVKYMEQNPDFTKSVGIESGDPNKIFEGENINIRKVDEKLLELIRGNERYEQFLHESGMRTEGAVLNSTDQNPDIEFRGVPNPNAEVGPPVQDPGVEFAGVTTDPEVVPQTESAAGGAAASPSSEALPQEAILTVSTAAASGAGNGVTESLAQVGTDSIVATYVSNIERPVGFLEGLFGGVDIRGTFEAIKDKPLQEIIDLQQNEKFADELAKMGIKKEGWDRWVDEINAQNEKLPADPKLTVAEYMASALRAKAGAAVEV